MRLNSSPPLVIALLFISAVLLCGNQGGGPAIASDTDSLEVTPSRFRLDRPESRQQLLVTWVDGHGNRKDVTRKASYHSSHPQIATVTPDDRVFPHSEGTATITVQLNDRRQTVPVEVAGRQQPPPVSFRHEVLPILTKAGCNSGGCHGKAEGQNGFQLSIFGFDPVADHDALVKQSRGRRVALATPASHLTCCPHPAGTPHPTPKASTAR